MMMAAVAAVVVETHHSHKEFYMVYTEKTLDIEGKNLLFYSGEVHKGYTHSIITYFKRRNNGRK